MLVQVSCVPSTPDRTVRTYLQLLSGERTVTQSTLESITTEHYRNTEHPHLASLAVESREQALDLADELRDDPAIHAFMEKVIWDTTYETVVGSDNEARVVACVAITERRPGDMDDIREIPDLPPELLNILEHASVLSFDFVLKLEDGRWKIDEFTVPENLLDLLDIPDADENSGDSDPTEEETNQE